MLPLLPYEKVKIKSSEMASAKSNEKCLETFEKRWDEIGVEAESGNEVAAKMDLCVCDGCDHLKGNPGFE